MIGHVLEAAKIAPSRPFMCVCVSSTGAGGVFFSGNKFIAHVKPARSMQYICRLCGAASV